MGTTLHGANGVVGNIILVRYTCFREMSLLYEIHYPNIYFYAAAAATTGMEGEEVLHPLVFIFDCFYRCSEHTTIGQKRRDELHLFVLPVFTYINKTNTQLFLILYN